VDYFFVLEVGGKKKAFMLAYSSEYIITEKEELNAHIRDNVCPEFVVIKQICTHPGCTGKGFAQALYAHLYKAILDQQSSRPIFVEIVGNPLNPRSISFHTQAGFKQEFEYTPPDGMQRLVFSNKNLKEALASMESKGLD
jgi:predicted GNAT superfamily acetyltransferase